MTAATAGIIPRAGSPRSSEVIVLALEPVSPLSLLMSRRFVGAVRPAHEMPEIQIKIFRNFSPAFGFSHRDNVVKTFPGGASQQVGDEQFAVTIPGRSFFVSQGCRGYPSFIGDRTQNVSFPFVGAALMVNAVRGAVKIRLVIRAHDCQTNQQQ